MLVWRIECCCVCHQEQISKKADLYFSLYPCIIKYYLISSDLFLTRSTPRCVPVQPVGLCSLAACWLARLLGETVAYLGDSNTRGCISEVQTQRSKSLNPA